MLKCLKLDPEHARASRIAEEQFAMVKFEGGWIRKEQMDEILKGKADDQKRLDAAKKATAERFARDQEREIADRGAKLSKIQLALCTSDPKRRDGALESAGKAINESIDPGFGIQAVDCILANLQGSLRDPIPRWIRPARVSGPRSAVRRMRRWPGAVS